MPKDEFDFEDPLELNGVALLTEEDTTDAMCECFIEEFLRMGYPPTQVLALFRNPHYLGMNLVLQNRGEPFIRESIAEVFARWGRPVTWPDPGSSREDEALVDFGIRNSDFGFERVGRLTSPAPTEIVSMGAALPKLDL